MVLEAQPQSLWGGLHFFRPPRWLESGIGREYFCGVAMFSFFFFFARASFRMVGVGAEYWWEQ